MSLQQDAIDPFDCFGEDSGSDCDDNVTSEQNDQDDLSSFTTKQQISSNNDANNSQRKTTYVDENQEKRRKKLIEETNARLLQNNTINKQSQNTDLLSTKISLKEETEIKRSIPIPNQCQIPWPNRPPLYKGPMTLVSLPETMGGGRGYVASDDIPPGTLLLVEEPLLTWPDCQVGRELGLISILSIFDGSSFIAQSRGYHEGGKEKNVRCDAIRDLEWLHPTRIDVTRILDDGGECTEVEEIQIKEMMLQLSQRDQEEGKRDANNGDGNGHVVNSQQMMTTILQMASKQSITSSDSKPLTSTDIWRILLTMRYNGFTSGVYLHFALFNHDDDANCIKFMPEGDNHGHNDGNKNKEKKRNYSEVRTTKYVRKGEELTLHYMDPREVSHATRRRHLWDQHRFDIGDDMLSSSSSLKEMELVHGILPLTSLYSSDGDKTGDNGEDMAVTTMVEKTLDDLETMKEELIVSMKNSTEAPKRLSPSKNTQEVTNITVETLESIKVLEVTTQELICAASSKLGNERHILLIRCFRLHLDVVEILLRHFSSGGVGLTRAQQVDLMCRFVTSAKKLVRLQSQYLGGDHPDLARTYQDLSQGIEWLLFHGASKQLFALNDDLVRSGIEVGGGIGKTFNEWSKEENRCRNEYWRIEAFYPSDVEEHILKYDGSNGDTLDDNEVEN